MSEVKNKKELKDENIKLILAFREVLNKRLPAARGRGKPYARGKGRDQPQGRGYYKGSYSNNNYNNYNYTNKTSETTEDTQPSCYCCKKPGHLARDCWYNESAKSTHA